HTRFDCDWSSDVCSSDLDAVTAVIDVCAGKIDAASIPRNDVVGDDNIAEERQVSGNARSVPGHRVVYDEGGRAVGCERRGKSSEIGRASCRERVERTAGG